MVLKPTTCKEAIALFERENGVNASEAKVVELRFQWPPIEKMDKALSKLVACQKLSLSSNWIEKITRLESLKNLKILAINHNFIKSLDGLDILADTLEQLIINNNFISKLQGIEIFKRLQFLDMSNNVIRMWSELHLLQECPTLTNISFIGNPVVTEERDIKTWRKHVTRRLPQIIILDGIRINRDKPMYLCQNRLRCACVVNPFI